MKTEREMFEEWYKSVETQYHKALNNYDCEFDCYPNDYIQCRYFAWLASTNREGYKLVPVKPTAKQNREGVKKFVRHRNENTWACDAIDDVYKAMIEAVEK